jgi:hypothetical protein
MIHTIARALAVLAVSAIATSSTLAQGELTCTPAPNSVGSGAVLSWQGGANVFFGSIVVDGLPRSSLGIVLLSDQADETPFGNGVRCVGGVQRRLIAKRAAQGTMTMSIQEAEQEAMAWITGRLGQPVYLQYLYRDPAAGGAGFNLSSGLRITLLMGT